MGIAAIVVLTFLTIVTSIISLYLMAVGLRESTKNVIKRRLAMMEAKHPGSLKMPGVLREELLSEIPALNRILFKIPVSEKLAGLIEQANVQINVGQLLLLTMTIGMTGFLSGLLINRGIIAAIILGLFLAVIPYLYLRRRKTKRVVKFEELFPDTLETLARSLEAGHSLTSALQYVGQEAPDPVGTLFSTAFEEQALGLSYYDALRRMTARIDSTDLVFFITAVNIQRVTGGNLAEILKNLAYIIRERLKIKRQVRVYTAQGRLSGYILAFLPILLFFAIYMVNPSYMSLLYKEKVGQYFIATGLTLQIIGFFVIKKIIRIRI